MKRPRNPATGARSELTFTQAYRAGCRRGESRKLRQHWEPHTRSAEQTMSVRKLSPHTPVGATRTSHGHLPLLKLKADFRICYVFNSILSNRFKRYFGCQLLLRIQLAGEAMPGTGHCLPPHAPSGIGDSPLHRRGMRGGCCPVRPIAMHIYAIRISIHAHMHTHIIGLWLRLRLWLYRAGGRGAGAGRQRSAG